MLLLDPIFYEGISINGCRFLHILEPISSISIRDQLYARVIRYHSHIHLSKAEQYVHIYQWGTTLIYDINKVIYTLEYAKEWLKSMDQTKTILNLFDAFKDIFSPDDIILKKYNSSTNFKNEFNKTIQAISIEHTKIPLKCCIWTPSNNSTCNNKKLISCTEIN